MVLTLIYILIFTLDMNINRLKKTISNAFKYVFYCILLTTIKVTR